jgi:hypothetical protein
LLHGMGERHVFMNRHFFRATLKIESTRESALL